MRIACMNNLKQVGSAVMMYANDYNDYFPLCSWPEGQNPWQTYEACRVAPGTSVITRGPYNLGLLHFCGLIKDAKIFYCASAKKVSDNWTYEKYTVAGTWPSSDDDNVRTSYNYYPQRKETELVKGVEVGKLIYTKVKYAYGELNNVAPMKSTAINNLKSMSTDLVHNLNAAPHKDANIAGLNALFPDGHVRWQTARGNPQAFDPKLWDNVGSNPENFRILMNSWQP